MTSGRLQRTPDTNLIALTGAQRHFDDRSMAPMTTRVPRDTIDDPVILKVIQSRLTTPMFARAFLHLLTVTRQL